MGWFKSLMAHYSKPKANMDDLYGRLNHNDWKYGLQLISELEENGYRAGHLRGTMYVYLSLREEQGVVMSRVEPIKPEHPKLPRRQYRKKSGGRRVKDDPIGGLESSLSFA